MGKTPKHAVKLGVATYGLDNIRNILAVSRHAKTEAIRASERKMIEYLRLKSPVKTGQFRGMWDAYGLVWHRDDAIEMVADVRIRNMAHDQINGAPIYYGGKIVAEGWRDRHGRSHARDIPRAKIAGTKVFLDVLGQKIDKNLTETKKNARKRDKKLR